MRAAPLMLLLVACGAEQPPFAQLPLRDSLQAETRALTRLTTEERALLRERFLSALSDRSHDSHIVTRDETPAWTRFDAHRLATEQDAAASISIDGDRVSQVATFYDREARPEPGRLAFDTSRDDADTSALISQSLHGAAGALLVGLAGARAIARIDHAPFALARDDETLYVNPAWLVIMSEPLADAEMVSVVSQTSALTIGTITSYGSCQTDLRDACEACAANAESCDGRIVLSDYPTEHDECVAMRESSNVLRAACSRLVLERPEIAACVQRNEPDCLRDVRATNAFWNTFHGKSVCTKTLDRCAADPNYVVKISCDACNSSCKGCGPTINCNPTCNVPSSSSSSGSCKVCAATSADPSIPALSIGMALLPLLYFARRMKRSRQ